MFPALEQEPRQGLDRRRVRHLLVSLAIALLTGATIFAFSDAVRDLDYAQVIRALAHLQSKAIFCALAATAVSFAALIGREATAMRYIGARVPLAALTIAGFCGAALGNAVGYGMLTAAAVRYRIYGAVGVQAYDVARLVGFIVAGFAIGLAAIGGLASLVEAEQVGAVLGLPAALARAVGAAELSGVALLLTLGAPKSVRLGALLVIGPSRRLMAVQVLLTTVRVLGAAIALWVLMPPTPIAFFAFVGLFAAATVLGALSHVPGGAGVFELVVLWALKGRATPESIAAALIAYRAIYYFLPLALSVVAFACFEASTAFRGAQPRVDAKLAEAASRLSPTFMSVIAFGTGAMLLVSGATPTFGGRLAELSQHVPLWAVEASSFLGSVIGVVFLFVARGLLDRRDGAWRLAFALSLSSLVFSLVKGLAFGEAAFFLFFSALLLATRHRFDRPTSMFDQPFTWGWLGAVGAMLTASFGILWLAFHNHSGLHGLWWQFEFDAQAPRALRAMLGASVVAVAFGLRQLLLPPAGLARPPTALELEQARAVIDAHPRGDAMMAYMGDKSLLFSASGRAFLMFGKRGRSWIALFDPIGPREEWPELIDRFVAVCRHHGGRASFYQVRPDSLPTYLDAGFTAMKLGEEAVVDLGAFTLEGGAFARLRYALKRGERDGLQFDFLSREQVASRFDDLAEISAQWIEAQRGEEKGFSIAAFEPNYLMRQSVGLLTEAGRPVAFASVMATSSTREATLGLMRSAGAASPVAMEFLIARLILALRDKGYARFSLGVAPLSGLRRAPLSSRWHRLAALIWKHGDRFYKFQGLRTFKNKFNPVWEPRYFVASGAFGPFVALADAAALISSGPARVRESVDA